MVLERLESILEDVVDGFFGLLLRGKIQPLEIARRLTREAEEQKIITLNRVYVPNRFTVGLHAEDISHLHAIAPELQAEFERFVGEWTVDRDYSVSGAVQVTLEPAEKVRRGRMRIQAMLDDVRITQEAARSRLGLDLDVPVDEGVMEPGDDPEPAPAVRRRQAA